jgi:L-histidine N-alpha-methyltransferase
MPAASPVLLDVHLRPPDLRAALERDVRAGLCAVPKSVPPTWFYDEVGSSIFEEITRLPEYYPTRAERRILAAHADEVAALTGADSLVELGAGSCEKTCLLLDAMAAHHSLRRYLPFDVSAAFLEAAAHAVADRYPDMQVHAVVGDFLRHLGAVPSTGRRLIAFLGGTVGNLVPLQRARFFAALRATMTSRDRLLLGTDLVKDPARIVAAYDDSAGVTARFNRNVLSVLNRTLGADFVPERFDHVARWDPAAQWIEMRLRSRTKQTVDVADLAMIVGFEEGEDMLTEVSAKFSRSGIAAELARSGLAVERQWATEADDFLLTLARPSRRPGRRSRVRSASSS